jgi:hypothetical protein
MVDIGMAVKSCKQKMKLDHLLTKLSGFLGSTKVLKKAAMNFTS